MLKIIFVYTIFACLTLNTNTLNGVQQDEEAKDIQSPAFNVTHILLQSILFCGTDIVCDKSILRSLNIPDGLSVPKKCPDCYCNPACLYDAVKHSYHCCPDYFFQYGYQECKDLSVFSLVNKELTNVIASCPSTKNESLLENCTMIRSELDRLKTPPVLGQESYRVYQNRYCSMCNDEFDYEEFGIEIRCPNFEDFNFYSSYDEFFNTSKMQLCRLDFSMPFFYPPHCLLHYENMISSCNVTGTWKRYDYHIEKACISAYEAFYGIFKNIFCAMCNPPEFRDDLFIDNCTFLYPQTELCLNNPSIEASYPYKNYFCFGCNGFREDEYEDFTLDYIIENYLENESMSFDTTLYFKLSVPHFVNYFQKADMESNSMDLITNKEEIVSTTSFNEQGQTLNDDIVNLPTTRHFCSKLMNEHYKFAMPSDINRSTTSYSINITNLIYTSFAVTKHGACTPGLLPAYIQLLQRNCSCNVGCTSECCEDFALQQSWTCISRSYPGTENHFQNEFRVIDSCPFANRFQRFCLQRSSSDFYQIHPVDGLSEYKETYVNVFCYLCGSNVDSMKEDVIGHILQKVSPWPLNFRCKNYMNYRNFRHISQLVNHLKRVDCNVSFESPISAMRCSDVCDVDISTCNVTGTWKTFDEDVFTACEKSDIFTFPPTVSNNRVFKNIFCLVCNPTNIDHLETNQTCIQEEDPNLVRACGDFPTVHPCSRYKNVFCEECNNVNVTECSNIVYREIKEYPIEITSSSEIFIWSFRFTFGLSSYSDSNDFPFEKNPLACLPNQMYDKYHDTCRDLTCFPGKYEQNGACLSLFPFTKWLRYTLSLNMKFIKLTENNDTHEVLLQGLRNHIIFTVQSIISYHTYIEDLIIVSSYTCSATNVRSGDLLVYLKVFELSTLLNRNEVESKLINFTQSSSNWTLDYNVDVTVTVARSGESLMLPYLALKLSREENCFIIANSRFNSLSIYKNILVSPILTCLQIHLKGNEFGVDWTNIRNEYSYSGFSISVHKFESYFDGGLRVCAKDIQRYIQTIEEVLIHENRTLSFLTLTLICVSLFFLLITFLTYCVFPSLRTLPGWNNMILVIFLFFAQLCLVVRPFFRSTAMIVASALTHFFWLSTFFWLQVCSFHMYRVFHAETRSVHTKSYSRLTILKYLAYATGISVFIVSANVTVSLIITDGEFTGYDKLMTLMTSRTAFFVTLIGPLSIVCITNITFYIMTAYKIHSTPNVDSTTGYQIQLTVYVKLFTLTGVSWLLQVVDTFIGISFLSYIIALLNGLQGLFLFASYVYNNRVFNLYRNALHKFSQINARHEY